MLLFFWSLFWDRITKVKISDNNSNGMKAKQIVKKCAGMGIAFYAILIAVGIIGVLEMTSPTLVLKAYAAPGDSYDPNNSLYNRFNPPSSDYGSSP
jgi:hypothetical protein